MSTTHRRTNELGGTVPRSVVSTIDNAVNAVVAIVSQLDSNSPSTEALMEVNEAVCCITWYVVNPF